MRIDMTDKEKLEKIKALADKMYSRMTYLTSDTRPIRQAMDEYHQFIINEYHKKEPVSEKECMYSKDNYTDKDRKVLCEGCEEECKFNKKEEPASEDLEEAGKEWLKPQLDKSYANYGEAKMMELTHFDGYAMLDAIEFGANWQKQKDSIPVSEDLEEAAIQFAKSKHTDKTLQKIVAWDFKAGANWQKQQILDYNTTLQRTFELGKQEMKHQLMAKAVDATVHIDAGGYPYIPQMELYDYEKDIPFAKEGDKYKVILIKED